MTRESAGLNQVGCLRLPKQSHLEVLTIQVRPTQKIWRLVQHPSLKWLSSLAVGNLSLGFEKYPIYCLKDKHQHQRQQGERSLGKVHLSNASIPTVTTEWLNCLVKISNPSTSNTNQC